MHRREILHDQLDDSAVCLHFLQDDIELSPGLVEVPSRLGRNGRVGLVRVHVTVAHVRHSLVEVDLGAH